MRIFTILLFLFSFAITLPAQIVEVVSPSGIAGFYTSEAAGFGGSLADTVISGCVIATDPLTACVALTNPTEIAGNIAILDRGDCEFGVKCLNAEDAGAIAVIVVNNEPAAGTFSMGGGAVGGMVTIPCVMVNFEDGAVIKDALTNGDTVKINMGDISFPNDVSTSNISVLNAPAGTWPMSQIQAAGDFVVTPGGVVTNPGLNTASNPTITATINHTPPGGSATQVYSESGSASNIDPDSSSTLIVLPTYDPLNEGMGSYALSYEVSSDSMDEATHNNTFDASFAITQNTYARGRYDFDLDEPFTTIGYTIAGGGAIEFLSPLDLKYGMGYRMDSMIVRVSVNSPDMLGDISVTGYVYEWDDANNDSLIANDEIAIVAIAPYTFPSGNTNTGETVTVELLDFDNADPGYIVPGDNKRYLIGFRYEGAMTVFFGFDEGYDYTQYIELLGANATDFDLPYIGINTWDGVTQTPLIESGFLFTGVRGAVATGLIINSTIINTTNLDESQLGIQVFPNPVSSQLNATITMEEATTELNYTIMDMAGRTLAVNTMDGFSNEILITEDVSNLPSGQYFLNVSVDNGFRTVSFIVER